MLARILDVTPRLDSLVIWFEEGPFPATLAAGSISPARASIGVDTLFTYTLQLDDGGERWGRGASGHPDPLAGPARRRRRAGPGRGGHRLQLRHLRLPRGDLRPADHLGHRDDGGSSSPSPRACSPPATSSRPCSSLRARPPPSRSTGREGTDPATELPYTTVAEAADFDIPILDHVQAHPGVFTPNGDGTNDVAVLGFTLSRVSGSFVHVEIYDVGGRLGAQPAAESPESRQLLPHR